MVFSISRASSPAGSPKRPHPKAFHAFRKDSSGVDEIVWFVEVNTIEELIQLTKEVGNRIVLDTEFVDQIIVYDALIE